MTNLEIVLLLMALLAGLASVAQKYRIPYPILLVIGGLIIGFIPSIPDIHLEPDVVFLIFLPALLYEAAGNISWHDFREFRRPISTLAIWLVFFSTVAVAVVAHEFIPGFTWPLAFVLGAIISPPDAVAATSATKGLGLPKRLIAILEGESLVNDASALTAYRYAVGAVTSGSFVVWQAGVQFLVVAVGGVAVGIAIGYIFSRIHIYLIDNPTIETTLTLLVPFVSYLLAEHFHMSGVLAVVATGLYISWRTFELYSFRTRIQINGFWNIFVFLLNGFVFILIGSQLPIVLKGLTRFSLPVLVGYGLLISAVAIAARIIWIFPLAYISALFNRMKGKPGQVDPKELFIISWAGMRGVVSLATALALPLTLQNGQPFPLRNVILFFTFMVIFVTLVLQGLTLPFFVRILNVQEPPEKTADEEKKLRLSMSTDSIAFIEGELSLRLQPQVLDELKENFEQQVYFLRGLTRPPGPGPERVDHSSHGLFRQYLEAELDILHHQRNKVAQWHKEGAFSDETIRRVTEELDIRSLGLQTQLDSVPLTLPETK
ncbi:Na+/H+ antiporter [Larkinella soli]|uniref:Na+/H+ antiporter n=1 Tax=Larkinella soli TaxID=1770527 RepID=UPI000FFB6115|nr:Na+/H+ antiporter [Larkinella soli]